MLNTNGRGLPAPNDLVNNPDLEIKHKMVAAYLPGVTISK